jgi:hypothetical protein
MTEWYDPIVEAKRRHDEVESDLELHLGRGPWGAELLKLVTRYLGCVWQMEANDGRTEAEGIRIAMEKLTTLGSKCEPRRKKEEEEKYGN